MTTATDGADDLKSLFDPDMAAAMARMVEIVEEKGLTPPPPNNFPNMLFPQFKMPIWWCYLIMQKAPCHYCFLKKSLPMPRPKAK